MIDQLPALVGIPAAFAGGYWLKSRRTIDYRQRWREALATLDVATREPDTAASAKEPKPSPKRKKTRVQISQGRSVNIQVGGSMKVQVDPAVRGMATWDRRELEIERAKNGLPPADDLRGMATWDKRSVLMARAKYASRR